MKDYNNSPTHYHQSHMLDSIGENMENYYHNMYSNNEEKKALDNEKNIEDNEVDYISSVNLFTGHNPNY